MLTFVAFTSCLFVSALLFGGTAWTSRLKSPLLLGLTAVAIAGYSAVLIIRPAGVVLPNVSVFVASLFLGSALGLLLKNLPSVVSFCIAASVADIISYNSGATARINEAFQSGASNLLPYLCISLPVDDRIRPIVGIGDLFIIAAIYFAFHRLGHRSVLSFMAPIAGLGLALVVGLITGGVFAVPFIAGTTVIYLWYAGKQSLGASENIDVPPTLAP